ncbi:copper homeostasis protein CutC [Pelagibacterium halotolerans]|uniref:copper homeostasis protein CutC n=1 Tax=Pelagibacterium halotolerans TaxID=531813 RepID=UPI00384B9F54
MILEVCVDDADGLAAAVEGGADRIELCSALALGGLTPSPGLIKQAVDCPVPVYAMIRPRSGDFVYSETAIRSMMDDIDCIRNHGLDGVVFGASLPDGRLDAEVLTALSSRAEGMGRTLHRAFDLVPEFDKAIDLAVRLGFERILTSGGAVTAPGGLAALHAITAYARDRIAIMPGAGINAANVADVLCIEGINEIHASCSMEIKVSGGPARKLGFETPGRRATATEIVRNLKHAIAHPR